jgi:hypothetical protein
MIMFEVIFIDFQSLIVFADTIAEVRTKYPLAIRVNRVTIH